MALKGKDNAEKIWNFLKSKIDNDYGVAGLMGNLYHESGLRPTNLQQIFEKKFNMTDDEYTKAVDDGSYTNFVRDGAGYGLAQWTWWSRKEALQKFCQKKGTSIGDLESQLEYLWKELQGYKKVLTTLQNATSVLEASNIVLFDFERPADQGPTMQKKRADYGEKYFKDFATKPKPEPFYYRVRKAWDQPKTQIGAYTVLNNAIKACPPGHKVFNPDGVAVFTPPQPAVVTKKPALPKKKPTKQRTKGSRLFVTCIKD